MRNLRNAKCCYHCEHSGGGFEDTDYCYYCLFDTEWPKDRNDKTWYEEHFVNEHNVCDDFIPDKWFED